MSDLISRSRLIEDLRKDRESVYSYVFCHTDCQHEEELALDLEWFIENQPTVEAKEVVHGKWKEATPKGVHSWSKGYARCSACDETIWSGWEMNFCPNCGCDMRTSAE